MATEARADQHIAALTELMRKIGPDEGCEILAAWRLLMSKATDPDVRLVYMFAIHGFSFVGLNAAKQELEELT